ncbi:MerR family transcriptional regulator [Aureimonas ureilytica]|uniref:MerR family transcriptional regulator n=1 Tax=Aureimonas ureilytica TaxID=401562 RepID=UPI00036851CD|nr:MerR family DNA-binding transcriptional regulator [Aureimonas ureilytica]
MTQPNEDTSEQEFRITADQLLSFDDPGRDKLEEFRIGDLSREFGVTLRTLRFYEDRGLLSPERRGTTRIYSRRDRMRLRLVLLAKILGFSLTEAKQLIDLREQSDGQRKQLKTALVRFEEQRQILQDQKREIEESLEAMRLTTDFVQNCLTKLG